MDIIRFKNQIAELKAIARTAKVCQCYPEHADEADEAFRIIQDMEDDIRQQEIDEFLNISHGKAII